MYRTKHAQVWTTWEWASSTVFTLCRLKYFILCTFKPSKALHFSTICHYRYQPTRRANKFYALISCFTDSTPPPVDVSGIAESRHWAVLHSVFSCVHQRYWSEFWRTECLHQQAGVKQLLLHHASTTSFLARRAVVDLRRLIYGSGTEDLFCLRVAEKLENGVFSPSLPRSLSLFWHIAQGSVFMTFIWLLCNHKEDISS